MSVNLRGPAGVQYDDWIGTVGGDVIDINVGTFESVLGIDESQWRLLVVHVHCYGGNQHVQAWGVPDGTGYTELERMCDDGGQIDVTKLVDLDYDIRHPSTNPPAHQIAAGPSLVSDLMAYVQAAGDPDGGEAHTGGVPGDRDSVDRARS